jgi:hypothetical protein
LGAAGSLRCATLSGVFVLLPMLSGELRAHHGQILRELTKLVEAGRVAPIVDPRRLDLDSALGFYALLIVATSTGPAIPQRGARQHCRPPLHRNVAEYLPEN